MMSNKRKEDSEKEKLFLRKVNTTYCQESRILGKSNVLSRCIVCLDKIQAAINNGEENPSFTDW